MPTPSPAGLLAVWEQGYSQTMPQRALGLLRVTFPEASLAELGELSVGQRDAALLQLRERAFGSKLSLAPRCPACRQQLELEIEVKDVRQPGTLPDGKADKMLEREGYEVRFRLPSALDLVELTRRGAVAVSQLALLERCVLEARHAGRSIAPADLPEDVLQALEDAMEAADPQSDVRLAVSCPACEHEFEAVFDIVAFLWAETDAWARRTLYEVHRLASAYGWTEGEVLALSAQRRGLYLKMAAES